MPARRSLVLFTPLAYVDATDSWSFTSTRQRVIVTLAGVYVESIVGALALLVWATTGPSVLNTIAYQTVLLATITTALFNLNPLLRYDAYYLVSDLVGVPNLRARCEADLQRFGKWAFFGIRQGGFEEPLRRSLGLLAFGSAQLAYRVVIMTTIATVLVMKFGNMGIAMAALFLGLAIGRAILLLGRYIREAPELAGRRLRAACVVAACVAVLVGGVGLIPLSWPVHARGVSTFASVETIHAPSDGVVSAPPGEVGRVYPGGAAIMTLRNEAVDSARRSAEAQMRRSQFETVQAALLSPGEAMSRRASAQARSAELLDVERDIKALSIRAGQTVRVLAIHAQRPGVRVRRGDPLVSVGTGQAQAVLLLGPAHRERLVLQPGDRLTCRSPSNPAARFVGTVVSIGASSSRTLDVHLVDAAESLEIAIDPKSGTAVEPFFEIRVVFDSGNAPPPRATLVSQVPGRPMSTASMIHRRFSAFMNEIKRGFSER